MKSVKNIVLLTPGFPANSEDTTCIPALQLFVRELKVQYGSYAHIQVVTFQYPFTKGSYVWNGISCFSAGGCNTKFPSRWKTWTAVMKFLKRYHEINPIDIIHAFWLTECALVGRWVSVLTGAKLICHVMGQDVLPTNKYMKYIKLKNAIIIANSQNSANSLKINYKIQSQHIIPFGIEPLDFSEHESGNIRVIDVLGVGSISFLKNYSLFVDIFEKLKKEFPYITGKIIGDGPLLEVLKNKIGEKKLKDSLTLTGKLSRDEVLQNMASSKILLHTSGYESAGYVFLEALYSGMKVVSLNTGFLPNVPGAYPCNDNNELFIVMHSLLTYQQEFNRREVPLMVDTVKAVIKIYDNC